MSSGAWIFGYGSLVFRPCFRYREARWAILRGFARRFYQGSTDHRGVPGKPGRVATLVAEPLVWVGGRAYLVDAEDWEKTLVQLDIREQGGYLRLISDVELTHGAKETVPALVYIATADNPNWLGPAEPEVIAAQVRDARGPSGANEEYVRRLHAALEDARLVDDHIDSLVRALDAPDEAQARRYLTSGR
ncbi:MAG: gamma-glutamylcyclotransferase [Myxococcales bacterium]|nr:gamma-glutamylcyclotransferase [Myxococcales bacterium]